MKRSEVRDFIETGINTLAEPVGFISGTYTDWNAQPDKEYPFCYLESLKTTSEFSPQLMPVDSWEVVIHVVKQDYMGSAPDEYETLVDECDEIAQKLQSYYNTVVIGYKLITLKSIAREPLIKQTADCVSGVRFSFTLVSPDTTQVC